jgi:O-antigen ligase
MYLYGLEELEKSYGLGLGVAGVGSKLASETELFDTDRVFFSFHNFFLEMLVDFGFIPFLVMMYTYFRLIFKLLVCYRCTDNIKHSYYAKASALSLLTIIPASISPSSIIYIFTFWLVVGFSLANLSVYKRFFHVN